MKQATCITKVKENKMDDLTIAELSYLGNKLQEIESIETQEITELKKLIALYPNLTERYLNDFWENVERKNKK